MGDEVKHVQLRLDVDAYDILKSEATIAGLTPASLLKKSHWLLQQPKAPLIMELATSIFRITRRSLMLKLAWS